MTDVTEKLYELCVEQPFDKEKITGFIKYNKPDSEQITRTALKLCEVGSCSYSDYLYTHEKEPLPEELITYKWEELFDVLIEAGLDADLIICDDGRSYENVLQELQFFDDGDLGAKIVRNILNKAGNPNIIIDCESLFEDIDGKLMLDIQLGCYYHKWQLDNAWRFWLVMVGSPEYIHPKY